MMVNNDDDGNDIDCSSSSFLGHGEVCRWYLKKVYGDTMILKELTAWWLLVFNMNIVTLIK